MTASSLRAGSLLLNGSFEAPAQQNGAGYYNSVVPDDWTYNKTGTISLVNGTPAQSPGPEDGSQYVMLYDRAGISQEFNVPTAGVYTLLIYASAGAFGGGGLFIADTNSAGNKFINEKIGKNVTDWDYFSIPLTLAAGPDLLVIREEARNKGTIFIDDVTLTPLTSAPDEGSTLFLCNLAFGIVALCARKWRLR